MIKAIIFDCFGVLTADTWREFVGGLPKDVSAEANNLNRQYDGGFIELEDFLGQVEHITGEPAQGIKDLLTHPEGKNVRLLNYIAKLKTDYKIGLISNIGSDWIRREFLNSDELKLFDDMTLSFEVGATKPSPEIYKMACQKLGVEFSEAVFTDDVLGYCEAAQALGMKAVHYQNFKQFKTELEQILSLK